MAHVSVLLQEAIDGLELQDGDIYLDATVGSGGHMEEVWKREGNKVTLAGIDADEMSISIAREKLDLSGAKAKLAVLNFRNIDKAPEVLEIGNPTKILFDLGWSSDQFFGSGPDAAVGTGRGFSFQKDEPLIMTFKSNAGDEDTTAYDVVNLWSEESLTTILYGYGEERYGRRIAKAIVERRKEKPIETSKQLAEIVKGAVPIFYRFGRIHPATRTFQAIRIAVNDELRVLAEGLRKGFDILKSDGMMAVISFHSLEDRIVKNFFKLKVSDGVGELVNKKIITPSEEEINKNPRSRSAKLRIIQKTKKDD
jgi:16S rRNA (cytosine1402-N4)-methyltransferase